MQGREDNDTELKFHITNNSGYDFNVDAACCEASGAAVGFASIGCPDREETILQWENYVISQNTTGYFSFTFRPLSGVNARPLMINIPFTRYNEPETSTSTEADL